METVLAQKIKNIIFDYGNVIFEIDFSKAQKALAQIGINNSHDFFSHKSHNRIFNDFETAAITSVEFREGIRRAANNSDLTDQQIDDAWNSLLVGVPSAAVHDAILRTREKYRIFLLSNNNEIHYNWIINYLNREFGVTDNNHLFEKTYYSQHMFLRKPDVEIFDKVVIENQLVREETLFIDDSPQHLVGAKQAGLHTLLMDRHPRDLEQFLVDNRIL